MAVFPARSVPSRAAMSDGRASFGIRAYTLPISPPSCERSRSAGSDAPPCATDNAPRAACPDAQASSAAVRQPTGHVRRISRRSLGAKRAARMPVRSCGLSSGVARAARPRARAGDVGSRALRFTSRAAASRPDGPGHATVPASSDARCRWVGRIRDGFDILRSLHRLVTQWQCGAGTNVSSTVSAT